MVTLVQLVHHLLGSPDASNAEIARARNCDPRTVSRYRRLISGLDMVADDLRSLDEVALNGTLNPAKTYIAAPDYASLVRALPEASGRAQWREYVRRQHGASQPVLSYEQFMRRREGVVT